MIRAHILLRHFFRLFADRSQSRFGLRIGSEIFPSLARFVERIFQSLTSRFRNIHANARFVFFDVIVAFGDADFITARRREIGRVAGRCFFGGLGFNRRRRFDSRFFGRLAAARSAVDERQTHAAVKRARKFCFNLNVIVFFLLFYKFNFRRVSQARVFVKKIGARDELYPTAPRNTLPVQVAKNYFLNLFDKPVAHRHGDGFRLRVNLQFFVDIPHMKGNGVNRNADL